MVFCIKVITSVRCTLPDASTIGTEKYTLSSDEDDDYVSPSIAKDLIDERSDEEDKHLEEEEEEKQFKRNVQSQVKKIDLEKDDSPVSPILQRAQSQKVNLGFGDMERGKSDQLKSLAMKKLSLKLQGKDPLTEAELKEVIFILHS